MDTQLVKRFRGRWQAVAAVELEEQRAASIEQRWQQLNAIVQLAASLGVLPSEEGIDAVRRRWARLKEGQNGKTRPSLPK